MTESQSNTARQKTINYSLSITVRCDCWSPWKQRKNN